jgi:hypothetical protein
MHSLQKQSGQTFIRPLGRSTVKRFADSPLNNSTRRDLSRVAEKLGRFLGLLTCFSLLRHGSLLLGDRSGGETWDWILANQIPFDETTPSPCSPHSVFVFDPQLALRKKMLINPCVNRIQRRRNSEQTFRESVDINSHWARLAHYISQPHPQWSFAGSVMKLRRSSPAPRRA